MKKMIGLIGIIASGLLLSLEVYMLKGIQILEKMAFGTWYTNAWDYLREPPCAVGVGIPICVLVFSIIVFCKKEND